MIQYVLFDTGNGLFEEKNLGGDLKKALKDAEYFASHLTPHEMKRREEFELIACDVPDDADLDDIIYSDYSKEIIRDYKMGVVLYTACRETGDFIEKVDTIAEGQRLIEKYENDDRNDGSYVNNFYDIVNENHSSVI